MPEVQIQSSWLSTTAPMVSWLLVVVGWFFVSRDQDKKQRRKEYRDRIDSTIDLIDSIESDAISYFLIDGNNDQCPKLASNIKTNFTKLKSKLDVLNSIWNFDDHQSLRIDFWLAVTGEDFEVKSRQRLQSYNERLSEISALSNALTASLEVCYYNKQK